MLKNIITKIIVLNKIVKTNKQYLLMLIEQRKSF